MKEIAKIAQNEADGLSLVKVSVVPFTEHFTKEQTEIIRLTQSKALPEINIQAELLDDIQHASMYCGYTLHSNNQELKGFMTLLNQELNENFPKCKIDEVRQAIKNGIRGEYGAFVGLSVKNVCSWVTEYINSEKRLETIKIYNERKKGMEYGEKTPEEIDLIFKEAYENDVELAKNGAVVSGNDKMFVWCEKNGLIKLTADEKNQLRDSVVEMLEGLAAGALSHEERNYYRSIVEDKAKLAYECRKEAYLNHLKTFKTNE